MGGKTSQTWMDVPVIITACSCRDGKGFYQMLPSNLFWDVVLRGCVCRGAWQRRERSQGGRMALSIRILLSAVLSRTHQDPSSPPWGRGAAVPVRSAMAQHGPRTAFTLDLHGSHPSFSCPATAVCSISSSKSGIALLGSETVLTLNYSSLGMKLPFMLSLFIWFT